MKKAKSPTNTKPTPLHELPNVMMFEAFNSARHLSGACQRPGANDALAIPSRHGDMLYYRDGRVVHIGDRA